MKINRPPACNSRIAMAPNKQSSLLGLMYAKMHYSPPKGGVFAPPLPPLNPPLAMSVATSFIIAAVISKSVIGFMK